MNPMLKIDYYKPGHILMAPEGTQYVYENFTPRSSKLASKLDSVFEDKVVVFGLQGFIQDTLIEDFNENFFDVDKNTVLMEYQWYMDNGIGPNIDTSHIAALHDLGYLPLRIKALPEGSLVDIKVPHFTVINTHPDFAWLPGHLEDLISSESWKPATTATTAWQYRKLLDKWAKATGSSKDFVLWQGHDFSVRGMSGIADAANSGQGHLLSFTGTDNIPAIWKLKKNYSGAETFIGGSVPASEHSVTCLNGKDNEVGFFRKLITETFPTGVVSIVSDTWDFWNVITSTSAILKEEILARKENVLGLAKVVFRPDSGNPCDIVCGTAMRAGGVTPEEKGAVECLWDIFGGTVNAAGYKELSPRVGVIYGDSITLERAEDILERLALKGFASSNIVFGIGSFTYQYQTRDSYGFAMKATFGTVNGVDREIFKDPATCDGIKKSAKGLLRVEKEGDKFVLYDQQTREQEAQGELKVVFEDGVAYNKQSLADIRNTLHN